MAMTMATTHAAGAVAPEVVATAAVAVALRAVAATAMTTDGDGDDNGNDTYTTKNFIPMLTWYITRVFWGQLYGRKMETNVFNFTLFFLSPSLFSRYDIVQVPINLGK
jgi:hypothetical protein